LSIRKISQSYAKILQWKFDAAIGAGEEERMWRPLRAQSERLPARGRHPKGETLNQI
jgi:hypothetical protein